MYDKIKISLKIVTDIPTKGVKGANFVQIISPTNL